MPRTSHTLWSRAVLLAIAFGAVVVAGALPVAATPAAAPSQATQPADRLTPLLRQVATAGSAEPVKSATTRGLLPPTIMTTSAGEVLVYIRLDRYAPDVLAALRAAGADIRYESPELTTVTARVAPAELPAVAAVGGVGAVWEMHAPMSGGLLAALAQDDEEPKGGMPAAKNTAGCAFPNVGAFTTEGVQQMRADIARQTLGLDGSGITVGIISNSFDIESRWAQVPGPTFPTDPQGPRRPATSVAQDIASGDLPGPGNPCGRTTPVTVVAEMPTSFAPSFPAALDEGRAMAQIVHDIAPGARLLYATAASDAGLMGFADNIRALRAAGADIIVDDIRFPNQGYFQEDPVAAAVTEVRNAGVIVLTAAGNDHRFLTNTRDGITAYEAPAFRPINCPDNITRDGQQLDLSAAQCHDFDPGADEDPRFRYTMAQSEDAVLINFQWGEPFYGATTDFDVYILSGETEVMLLGEDPVQNIRFFAEMVWNNAIMKAPNESGTRIFANPGAASEVNILVVRRSGNGTPPIKWIMSGARGTTFTGVEYRTSTTPQNNPDRYGQTLYGQAVSNDLLSVAALNVPPANGLVSAFSGNGPATLYIQPAVAFDPRDASRPNQPPLGTFTPAQPYATPQVRNKPDFLASNNGLNTFFGTGQGNPAGSAGYRFSGTSAAAPHAAGVAALLLQRAEQRERTLTFAQVETALESTALSINQPPPFSANPEPANRQGAGLLQADAAALTITSARLNLTTAASSANVVPGSVFTHTVTLANIGPDAAQNVSLTITPPTGATIQSVAADAPLACNTATPRVCTAASMPNAATVQVRVVMVANTAGSLATTATATTATTLRVGSTLNGSTTTVSAPPPPRLLYLPGVFRQ